VLTAIAVFLIPWCAVLGMTLPDRSLAENWSLAWVGLDGAVAVTAAFTVLLLQRNDARAALTAMATATLLAVDSWFDLCTSHRGPDQLIAGAEAVFLEVPLAVLGCVLACLIVTRSAATYPNAPGIRR